MTKEDRDIQRKLKVLRHAEKTGHVARTCRYFGVGRSPRYGPDMLRSPPTRRTLPLRKSLPSCVRALLRWRFFQLARRSTTAPLTFIRVSYDAPWIKLSA